MGNYSTINCNGCGNVETCMEIKYEDTVEFSAMNTEVNFVDQNTFLEKYKKLSHEIIVRFKKGLGDHYLKIDRDCNIKCVLVNNLTLPCNISELVRLIIEKGGLEPVLKNVSLLIICSETCSNFGMVHQFLEIKRIWLKDEKLFMRNCLVFNQIPQCKNSTLIYGHIKNDQFIG